MCWLSFFLFFFSMVWPSCVHLNRSQYCFVFRVKRCPSHLEIHIFRVTSQSEAGGNQGSGWNRNVCNFDNFKGEWNYTNIISCVSVLCFMLIHWRNGMHEKMMNICSWLWQCSGAYSSLLTKECPKSFRNKIIIIQSNKKRIRKVLLRRKKNTHRNSYLTWNCIVCSLLWHIDTSRQAWKCKYVLSQAQSSGLDNKPV